MVWWESFAVADLKKKEWRVSWKCEKIARDRVWESWSAGSVISKVCKCLKLWGKNSLSWDSKLYRSSRSSKHIWDLNLQSELHHQNPWNATSKAQRTMYLFWMALYLNPSLYTKYGQTNPLHHFITDSYSPLLILTLKSLISGNCDFFSALEWPLWNSVWIEHLLCTTLRVQFQL